MNTFLKHRIPNAPRVYRKSGSCYTRFRISTVIFQYYEEHQYPNRSRILKPVTCNITLKGFCNGVLHSILLFFCTKYVIQCTEMKPQRLVLAIPQF
jgi:hypothetical protein